MVGSARVPLVVLAALCAASMSDVARPQPAATQQASPANPSLPPALRFDIKFEGALALDDRGLAERVQIDYRTWYLQPRNTVRSLPFDAKGYLVVELHSGKLSTVIGDTKQQRQLGEIWVVPPDAIMTLESEDDTVIFKTIFLPLVK